MGIKINKNKKLKKTDYLIFFIFTIWMCYLFCSLHHSFMYSDPDYVCRHMARDLESNLEKIGLDVKLVSNHKHMWISISGIEIDSVSFIPMYFYPHNQDNITTYESYGEYQTKTNST